MIVHLHPENPEKRKITELCRILKDGGVIIIPTDSVYALVCDMNNQKAVDQICKLRNLDPVKANLTFLCDNISRIANFTSPIPNEHFRLMKRNLPGPFTFILKSNQAVPKLFKNKKRTIGARIPNHVVVQALIAAMDNPLMSSSLKLPAEDFHKTDINEIHAKWGKRVDAVIESGTIVNEETTIVDLSQGDVEITREGHQPLLS